MDPALCDAQEEARLAAAQTGIADLAKALGLKTGDQVPPPAKAKPTPGKGAPDPDQAATDPVRWSRLKKTIFAVLEPQAVALIATDGPISVTIMDRWGQPTHRYGHNRGVWPAKLAKTTSWRDTITPTYDKSPLPEMFVGVQFRLWCATTDARDRLAEAMTGVLAAVAERQGGLDTLRPGFYDLGVEMDLALLEAEAHALGDRLGLRVRDDAGLSGYLDQVTARVQALAGMGQVTEALIMHVLGRG